MLGLSKKQSESHVPSFSALSINNKQSSNSVYTTASRSMSKVNGMLSPIQEAVVRRGEVSAEIMKKVIDAPYTKKVISNYMYIYTT